MEKQEQNSFDMSAIDLDNPAVRKMLTDSMAQFGAMATKGLRPAEYEETVSERIKIPLCDGVRLSAFLTKPAQQRAYPVILVRNPYVSNSFVYEGILPIFAKYGYATILVEVRGSQTSEGEWLPFENEMKDGRDVLDWIAAQDWCDGNIGCFGGSYLGHTQWAVANSHHPALKSLFIQVYGPTPYDTFWRRGMFRQDIWSVWVTQMMGPNRFKAAPPREQLLECTTYRPQDQIGEHFIGEHVGWYTNWVKNNKQTDDYWTEGFWGDFYKTAEETCVPVLLEGGWNDIFLRPEMEAFRRMPTEIREQSRFLIGPWNHGGQCNGDIAASGEKIFYLAADGAISDTLGTAGSVGYVYDPENCPENPWGNVLGDGSDQTFGGPRKQRPVGSREDELYFLSPALTEDLDIAGAIRAELYVSSDAEATAFSITVSEVFANGDAVNIRNDITDIRYRDETSFEDYVPGSTVKLSLTMLDVTWRMKKGSRLRIDIASSNHPAYHIHPNTTECWAEATTSKIAHQRVYFGENQASRLILPIR